MTVTKKINIYGPFRSYISKTNNTLRDNYEDFDIAMSVYNLLECSENCSLASWRFCNCDRDKFNNDTNEVVGNRRLINGKRARTKYLEYKTRIIRRTTTSNSALNAKVVISLKY